VPPALVALRFGKPVTRFQPVGVAAVAVMLRDSLTRTSRSPTATPAGAPGARLAGVGTLFATNDHAPALLKVGVSGTTASPA
jgi:hypothetical protein